jgi:hypothetical protein
VSVCVFARFPMLMLLVFFEYNLLVN